MRLYAFLFLMGSVLFSSFLILLSLPDFAHAEILSAAELQQKFTATKSGGEKIKILIVPGHDNQNWGTEYNGVKEVELNRIVANKLYDLFSKDAAFTTYITQQNGNYTEEFARYLETNWDEIRKFKNEQIAFMSRVYESGEVEKVGGVPHNTAKEDVALVLYGINKWANEHDIDLVIHVHFNDYGGRTWNKEGEYNGFTIYVPEAQLKNAEASKAIAQKVYAQLSKFTAVSNLPGESGGVTEEQDLIAIGSHSTLDSASMLIEYGYIYEPQLVSVATRNAVLNDVAYRTYVGVKDFFKVPTSKKVSSLLFPKLFSKELKKGMTESVEVLALQKALVVEAVYPGVGKTLNDCPVSGNFGTCTEQAVKALQKKYKLPTTGLVGPMTRKILNSIYGK